MKSYFLSAVLGCCLLQPALAQTQEACKPIDLICDYLEAPLGVDNPHPRLAWRLEDARQGARQTAYQIVVDRDSLAVVQGTGRAWNTGKIPTDQMLVPYAGQALQPFTAYFWKVTVWDKDGQASTSEVSRFETGLMGMEHWTGAWIGDGRNIDYKPAPYFRKVFEAKKKIKSARAYIAVAGLYELYLNGTKIGNHRLDPLYTRFDRKNFYVTYDVTDHIQSGQNAIGVLLGNGWYNHQSMGVWDFHQAPWRNRPTFCLDLRITYDDGTVAVIATDRSWKTSGGGLIFNSIYTGEHYDARLEQPGWNTVDFNDARWRRVSYRGAPSPNIVSQQVQPIRAVDTLPAVAFRKYDDTTYVYDFGQNMAGITRLQVTGPAGTVVRIKHGERRYDNGRVDVSNIDVYHRPVDDSDPFQTDILLLSGTGEDTFTPRFNYKGFRYVEVTSDRPIALHQNSLTAFFVHSDVTQTGTINASNPLVNGLWQATNNAYLSNLMGYPTDCPQREKNGWTGDGHFAIETALYNYDGITVYEKWLADHRDEQQPNGVLPDIIPTGGWGYGTDNGLDWTSTIAIIPWNIYMFYGDSHLLSACYDNIKRYVDYVDRTSPDGLSSWGRGDWVPVKSPSNKELTSSVYFYVDTWILAQAARLFNKADDYTYYNALAQKIKNAINAKFLDPETGRYASGVQTEQSVPLMWGVVPEDMKAKVVQRLAQQVEAADFHLDVGVLGAKAILNALSQNGAIETAYKVAVQDTYPSWGHWIANGATTLLENWDLNATRDISDNHMMFGEIGGWFFKGLGGLYPDPQQPGFKHILLRPNFPTGLDQFEATHRSPYGQIRSAWERKNNRIYYHVTIPPNSTATLYVPDHVEGERTVTLEAGTYDFTFRVSKPRNTTNTPR